MTNNDLLIYNKFNNESDEYKLFIELLIVSSSRIAALLRLTGRNVMKDGTIIIEQDKQSRMLITNLVLNKELIIRASGKDCLLFPNLTYARVYRDFVKWGIYSYSFGNINKSVTHTFRKKNADNLYNMTRNVDSVTALLGHNSKRSAEYYIEDKRKNIKQNKGIFDKTEGTINNLTITRGNIIYIAKEKRLKKLDY